MGAVIQSIFTSDFNYEYTDQPHLGRRKHILEKHPEIKKLMSASGKPTNLIIRTTLTTIMLLSMAYWITTVSTSYFTQIFLVWPASFLSSYLFIAMHEAVHGLVFGPNHATANMIFGCLVNLPLILPIFALFKKHHRRHHSYQGDYEYDNEYPTTTEANLFSRNAFTKYVWASLASPIMIVRFYGKMTLSDLNKELLLNVTSVILFDILVYKSMANGLFCLNWLCYCFGVSTSIGMIGLWNVGVHTVHYNAEETSSYYGPMNMIYLNFGCHVEHHDFPNIQSRHLLEKFRHPPHATSTL